MTQVSSVLKSTLYPIQELRIPNWVFFYSLIEQSSKQFASAVQALERIQRSGIKAVA